jgi:hypothetical protein
MRCVDAQEHIQTTEARVQKGTQTTVVHRKDKAKPRTIMACTYACKDSTTTLCTHFAGNSWAPHRHRKDGDQDGICMHACKDSTATLCTHFAATLRGDCEAMPKDPRSRAALSAVTDCSSSAILALTCDV